MSEYISPPKLLQLGISIQDEIFTIINKENGTANNNNNIIVSSLAFLDKSLFFQKTIKKIKGKIKNIDTNNKKCRNSPICVQGIVPVEKTKGNKITNTKKTIAKMGIIIDF